MITLVVGAVVYVLGSAWDAYTTKRAVVDHPGLFREANRLLAPIVARFGVAGLTVAKLAPLGFLVWLAFAIDAKVQVGVALAALGAWFGWLGVKNRRLYRRIL